MLSTTLPGSSQILQHSRPDAIACSFKDSWTKETEDFPTQFQDGECLTLNLTSPSKEVNCVLLTGRLLSKAAPLGTVEDV